LFGKSWFHVCLYSRFGSNQIGSLCLRCRALCVRGAVPMAPKRRSHSSVALSDPNATHDLMFTFPQNGELRGRNIVKQSNVMLKMCRLSWGNDVRSRGVVPMTPGSRAWAGGAVGAHSSGPLSQIIIMPLWEQQLPDRRYGRLAWDGNMVQFKWQDLWRRLHAKYTNMPFPEPAECLVETDGGRAPQPWCPGPGMMFIFNGQCI